MMAHDGCNRCSSGWLYSNHIRGDWHTAELCECSDECHECHRIVPAGELDRYGRCDAEACRELSGFDGAIAAMAKGMEAA